jgi:hypothetical protein
MRKPIGGREPFPEALAGVLLHGPQGVLGVLLGLVLVEQRHDLPDHVAHGVVAELLGDRDQPDAVLGKAADVELKLELVAEESAEAVHHDRVEHRRLGGRGVDHALELRPPIIGSGCAGLDILGNNLPAARGAVSLPLAALVWNREVDVGLSSGRDSQVEGSTDRRGHSKFSRVIGGSRTTHRTDRRTRPRTSRSRPR